LSSSLFEIIYSGLAILELMWIPVRLRKKKVEIALAGVATWAA
jgi:hypothetical protein